MNRTSNNKRPLDQNAFTGSTRLKPSKQYSTSPQDVQAQMAQQPPILPEE
ncbi:MAG: hypothetical protein K0S39_5565 [Paenibacillus sp.]|jgi:hypothetical protein|nr:hypothetical protein [Paenibacillus sp.]